MARNAFRTIKELTSSKVNSFIARNALRTIFYNSSYKRFLQRFLHGSYTVPTVPTKTQRLWKWLQQQQHIPVLSRCESRARSSMCVKRHGCHGLFLSSSVSRPSVALAGIHAPHNTRTKIAMQHHRTRVRPERKKRPLYSRRAAPPHPQSMQCWLPAEPSWGQVSRCEKIVPFLFENGVPKPPTLQGRGRLATAKGWVGGI